MLETLFLGIPTWKWFAASSLMLARLVFFGLLPSIHLFRRGEAGMNRAPLRGEQLRREWKLGLLSVAMQILSFYQLRGWVSTGASRLYVDPLEYGVAYLFLQIPLFLIFVDAAFYVLHRLLHTRFLFKHVHGIHHRSRDISPLTNLAMHPLEAYAQVSLGALATFLFPVNEFVITFIGLGVFAYNFYLHSAREVFPKNWLSLPGLRWMSTSTYHHMHHTHLNSNFGLYFRFWDVCFKTESTHYPRKFQEYAREAL